MFIISTCFPYPLQVNFTRHGPLPLSILECTPKIKFLYKPISLLNEVINFGRFNTNIEGYLIYILHFNSINVSSDVLCKNYCCLWKTGLSTRYSIIFL